jgi:ABC-type polysaccharide/polyol phosphate transport system ATPase subunit
VEKFMDTPVKRYSSGMYVRLAFAVAAHLKPEILRAAIRVAEAPLVRSGEEEI